MFSGPGKSAELWGDAARLVRIAATGRLTNQGDRQVFARQRKARQDCLQKIAGFVGNCAETMRQVCEKNCGSCGKAMAPGTELPGSGLSLRAD